MINQAEYRELKESAKTKLLRRKKPVSIAKLLGQFPKEKQGYVRLAYHELAAENVDGIMRLNYGWFGHTKMKDEDITGFANKKPITKEVVFFYLAENKDQELTANQIEAMIPFKVNQHTISVCLSQFALNHRGAKYDNVKRVGDASYMLSMKHNIKQHQPLHKRLVKLLKEEGMMSVESLTSTLGVDRHHLFALIYQMKSSKNIKIGKIEMLYLED